MFEKFVQKRKNKNTKNHVSFKCLVCYKSTLNPFSHLKTPMFPFNIRTRFFVTAQLYTTCSTAYRHRK